MVAGRGHLRRKSRDFEEIDEDRDVSFSISTKEYAVSRVKTIYDYCRLYTITVEHITLSLTTHLHENAADAISSNLHNKTDLTCEIEVETWFNISL
jgi:transcriptional regulator